jgi:hypothetical protein
MIAVLAGVGTTLVVAMLIGCTSGIDSWPAWIFSLPAKLDELIEPARYSSYAYEGTHSWLRDVLPFALWSPVFAVFHYRLLTPRQRSNQALQPTTDRSHV